MPRTELGPATCNRSRWNPADGHSPITKRDRLDARFINSTSQPPRKGKQTIGPATDNIVRSNLEPGESAFDRVRPLFDRNWFKKGHRHDYTDYRLPDSNEKTALKILGTNTGAAVPAVCEGESCGGDVSAKSTAKFGSTSFEYLNRRARSLVNLVVATVPGAPLYFGRIAAAAIMKLKLFRPQKIERQDGRKFLRHVLLVRHNGRLFRHIFRGWFGQNYPWRWDQAASCYLDIRIDGKATNSADLTWSQAAARMTDEVIDNLSPRQGETYCPFPWWNCPLIFYEKPFLCIFLFWLMAGLDAPLRDFWFFVAEPPSLEKKPRPYVPSNIYREGKAMARLVSLNELLSASTPRLAQYYRECWPRVVKALEASRRSRGETPRPTAPSARDKAIASHWRLVAKKCRIVPQAHRTDAIQACMERLVKVWEDWDSESGTFGTFAAQAIDWEIQDFLKQLRRQVPVQRSINLNDPADNHTDDDDDDRPPEPERPDMMRFNEGQVTAAKRRLVAERLGCLNWRERRVMEGRLALNGHECPVTHKALAADLGIDDRQIRRIESRAVEKLRRAIL